MRPEARIPKMAAPGAGGGGTGAGGTPPGMEQRHIVQTDGSELHVKATPPIVQNTVAAFEGTLQPPTAPGPLPPGFRHEHVDPDTDGRSLDVTAEEPIASSILDKFRLPYRRERYLAEQGWQGRFHRSAVGRWLFQTRESDYTINNLVWTVIATGVLAAAVGIGLYTAQENANQPIVNRTYIPPHRCVNVPGDTIAMGSNVSVNGEIFNTSPQSAAIIQIQPSLNPIGTSQVCSGNFEAAVDVVRGPAGFVNQVFTDDFFLLQDTGCVENKGCGQRVTGFRR